MLTSLRNGMAWGVGLLIVLGSAALLAQTFSTFSSGEIISASAVNENFQIAAPDNAIVAFYQASCPSGWVEADGTGGTPDLRGRFIRGLDDFGSAAGAAGRDPDGVRTLGANQGDAFQDHQHWRNENNLSEIVTLNTLGGANGGDTGRNGLTRAPTGLAYPGSSTSSETRPENVALNYCMRKS